MWTFRRRSTGHLPNNKKDLNVTSILKFILHMFFCRKINRKYVFLLKNSIEGSFFLCISLLHSIDRFCKRFPDHCSFFYFPSKSFPSFCLNFETLKVFVFWSIIFKQTKTQLKLRIKGDKFVAVVAVCVFEVEQWLQVVCLSTPFIIVSV